MVASFVLPHPRLPPDLPHRRLKAASLVELNLKIDPSVFLGYCRVIPTLLILTHRNTRKVKLEAPWTTKVHST